MKVAITGHTQGIGKALADVFPNHIGFSRSNGFDITDLSARQKIIGDSQDCDIFVNNAYSGFSQVDMLFELWEQWKDKDKIIVCLGSVAADFVYGIYPIYRYAVQKKALEDACKHMAHTKKPCKVICVKPGFTDTQAIQHLSLTKIAKEDLALQIKEIVEFDKTFWITTATLYPR